MAGFNHTGINATGFITSYWVLVGIGTLGLPQNAVRGMGFKSTQAMHRAMIFGTFVVGFLMIGMHFGGALIGPTLEGAELASTDYYVPYFAINEMPAGLAGLLLAAPPNSGDVHGLPPLLILASASIIRTCTCTIWSSPKSIRRASPSAKAQQIQLLCHVHHRRDLPGLCHQASLYYHLDQPLCSGRIDVHLLLAHHRRSLL